MTAIIVINWNGFKDTIECLSSLRCCVNKDFFVIVCDNGSTDESVSQITDFCIKEKIPFDSLEKTDVKPTIQLQLAHVILYRLGENNGFSRGNNIGLKLASFFAPDNYLLLNNDTVVEPDFLVKLVDFQRRSPEVKVLTPLIHYFYDKRVIWNGGGNMYWGFRLYHFADKNESVVPKQESISCTYITGCALFFAPCVLKEDGSVFSESFFFGEEDFEFGLRMKQQKVRMACVLNSVIYHKVGGSRKSNEKKIGHTYIYYLNRLINVRHFLPKWQYYFYKPVLVLSAVRILRKVYNMNWKNVLSFIKRLSKVSKEFFLDIVRSELK